MLPFDPRTERLLGSVEDVKKHYAAVGERLGIPVTPPEAVVNLMGYEALTRGETERALAFFRLNSETYPDSANVWDSLGDALDRAGKKDEALASYEKAAGIAEAEGNPLLPAFRKNVARLRGAKRRALGSFGGSSPGPRISTPRAWRPDSSFPARRTTRHVNHSSDCRFVTWRCVPTETSSVQRMRAPVGPASSVQPAESFRRPTRTPMGMTVFARSLLRRSCFMRLSAAPGGRPERSLAPSGPSGDNQRPPGVRARSSVG